MADLDPERSVVLDICTGTAAVGFTFGMGKCLAMRLTSWGTPILRGDGKANDFRALLADAGRS